MWVWQGEESWKKREEREDWWTTTTKRVLPLSLHSSQSWRPCFASVAAHQVELGPACTSGKAWSRRGWMEGFILGVVEIVGAWRGDRFRVDELSVLGGWVGRWCLRRWWKVEVRVIVDTQQLVLLQRQRGSKSLQNDAGAPVSVITMTKKKTQQYNFVVYACLQSLVVAAELGDQ